MRLIPTVLVAACATAVPPKPTEQPSPPVFEAGPREPPQLYPWFRSWDATAERARLARAMESGAIEAEYVKACGPVAAYRIIGSPLVRYRTTSWNTSTGAIITLSPMAGTPESLLADFRCHLIGMVMSPFGMEDCPFDVPGLHVDMRGDETGIVLQLTVADPARIPDLQQRLGRAIEAASRSYHED